MYCGYVVTLNNLRKHSNANRLQCAEIFGCNVIVDLSYHEGQTVVYFPVDGQLSEEFAEKNNLVRKKDENGNNVGGYLDHNKRNITALKLRGEKSDGLVLPIESLSEWTDITKLKNGDQISILNGYVICQKYIPQMKGKSENYGKSKKTQSKTNYEFFAEHKDTEQLAYNKEAFKLGDIIYITRKLHGTSGRTMNTTKVYKTINRLRSFFQLPPKIQKEKAVITGTRRVVLENIDDTTGYYSDNRFRKKWHELLKDKLPEGMEVFYEIVGYVNENTPIMGTASNKKVKDKEFSKKFGPTTLFSYGCNLGECEMYVYRMTMTTPEGTVIELPWEQVENWCERLGLKHVPDLEKFMYTTWEDLQQRVHKYIDNMPVDEIGKTHIAEGVVVRIDNRPSFTAFKEKTFEFKVIEGIIKDGAEVPDIEEAEELIVNGKEKSF